MTGQDNSRSAIAFRKGRALVRDREVKSAEDLEKALLADETTAQWMQENSGRGSERIWEKNQGPLIRVVAGTLHVTTTEAEDALITSGLPVYQRGDTLVRPVTRDVPASRGRTVTASALGELNVHSMVDMLCGVAEWERFDARAEDWVRINPPSQVAQVLLARNGYWRLPSVAGIITTPTLRADGSLLTAAGYDPATRLFHAADPALKLLQAVRNPTRAAAEEALKALEALLTEFPFVTHKVDKEEHQVAKAVALSAMITPIVRGAMPVAPLHAFNAHAPGSGKSYLVDVVSMIGAGRPCPVITAAPDEGETEKRIAGLLLAGYPIVSLDNVNGELGGDLLCQAIERPLIRIRRLGASDIIEVESCVSMFATGNNLRVRGDMVRRALVAELDPEMERPELREFKQNPVATIEADRGRYVSAALVIVGAYLAAGCPNKLPPIASFEAWSDLVRSALVWLGCADPCLSMEKARDDDPDLAEIGEMMAAWHEAIGADALTCRRVVEIATSRGPRIDGAGDPEAFGQSEPRHAAFSDLLTRLAGFRGNIDTTRFGRWLHAKEGRIVAGFRFKRDGKTDGSARWKLENVRRG